MNGLSFIYFLHSFNKKLKKKGIKIFSLGDYFELKHAYLSRPRLYLESVFLTFR